MPQLDQGIKEFVGKSFRNAAAARDTSRLVKTALKMLTMADRHVADCQSASPEFLVACKEGCAACCHRQIRASLAEVLAVADHVASQWPPDQISGLQERLGSSEAENGPFWRDEAVTATAPCAFLVEGRCSIYEMRPTVCRSASSKDASECQAFYHASGPMPAGVPGQILAAELSAVASAGCQAGEMVAGLLDFGPAVGRLLRRPEMAGDITGRISAWEGVKLASEWSTREDSGSLRAANVFSDPSIRPLIDLAREGRADEIQERLATGSTGIAGILLAMTLPGQYESQDHLESSWSRLDSAIARFEEWAGDPGEAFECLHYFNTFNWAYAGKNVRPVMERFMAKAHRLALRASPSLTEGFQQPRRPGRFRLGYVSARLKSFNGSRWALGTLRRHDPEIETYALNLSGEEDPTSLAFRRAADHYAHLPLRAEEAGAFIRGLDLDALIFTDVGMCGRSLQLASMRLARRQFNSWGHPVTSGSPSMDFYLSSEAMEPPDGDSHYSEKLIRLPGNGLSTSFRPAIPSQASPEELGVPSTGFLLYCQIPSKQIPLHDPLFRRVIAESSLPLVLVGAGSDAEKAPLMRRLGAKNTIFLDVLSRPDYLRLVQLAEATIESPAFGGGFTAIDSLSVGTPIITLPGPYMRGRLSNGYLRASGLEGFVAGGEEDFVDLACNAGRRQGLMAEFDPSSLFDNNAAIEALDRLLLEGKS